MSSGEGRRIINGLRLSPIFPFVSSLFMGAALYCKSINYENRWERQCLDALLAEKAGGIGNHVLASAEKLRAFGLSAACHFYFLLSPSALSAPVWRR